MNCNPNSNCCRPIDVLAQELAETTARRIAAYNLAAQAYAATHPLTAGRNIDITLNASNEYEIAVKNPMDEDVVINADLTVNGDIYQNGSAYESHAEQLYTTKDTVIMRDGATTGLSPGDVAGLIMKKYDGTNDGALVVSNDGTARVGDVGSEQPLMTRDESGSMVNGELLQWNGTGQKAVCSGVNLSQIVRGSGNIGSDTKPIKVINGVAVEVADALMKNKTTNSYHGSGTYTGGTNHLIGNVIIQPAGSTIIMMHRMFTQNVVGITAGFRISGNNQFWVTTGNNTGGDYRMESILISTATNDRTIQAEIFIGQNAVIESDIEAIIIP